MTLDEELSALRKMSADLDTLTVAFDRVIRERDELKEKVEDLESELRRSNDELNDLAEKVAMYRRLCND